MSRVLLAPDKFKGTLTAAQVAAAVGAGIRAKRPGTSIAVVPVADGGDGTLAAAVAAGYEQVPVTVTGPTGQPVRTSYARSGDLAVVEMADACGLVRLPDGPGPMTPPRRAPGPGLPPGAAAGCRRRVGGIGGSAAPDGGAGMLQGLGAGLYDATGAPVEPGGGALANVARIDLEPLRRLMAGVEVTIASDVDNQLTGPTGAAAVYGPQKGADADQVRELDANLAAWAETVAATTGTDRRDVPGAGAAGGVGFAALAFLGATLRPGIDLVLDLVGFAAALDGADLVVTGEGALDEQTLHGKAPAGVAAAAGARGVPVVAVCGVIRLAPEQLRAAGITAAYALTDVEPDLQRCLTDGEPLLARIGALIAAEHLVSPDKEPA